MKLIVFFFSLLLLFSPQVVFSTTLEPFSIQNVMDGSTLLVISNSKLQVVHLLSIQTPETDQPFGNYARDFTRNIIEGRTVKLDVVKVKDNEIYAHVYADNISIQALLLEKGWARFIPSPSCDSNHEQLYRIAESRARREEVGIWEVKGYVQKDGFHVEAFSRNDKPREIRPENPNPSSVVKM